ncbi:MULTISPECIES: hypothetical protein [unclassified Streptomyces]|uniref:hypothetical protein n=1 Tax=unclassified Streptomyces TaxID=2593676 RepID=UPI002E77115D|nr:MULTISPECIES: hypothetical protein [unclassified Streptomyces]MEE1759757.1 hypothetical protein [Streptomyces sp. SP18BB07]MEE1829501.1 hypothetical protein [Streptomyces sp. SP17KL33]
MSASRIRSIRTSVKAAAAALLAAPLIIAGLATPAAAGTNCDGGYHCVFWSGFDSAQHRYFNSDTNFAGDTFNRTNFGSAGANTSVNDNAWSASNSSTGGYYSKYYLNSGYTGGMLICIAPGRQAEHKSALLTASSLQLSTSNPGGCF